VLFRSDISAVQALDLAVLTVGRDGALGEISGMNAAAETIGERLAGQAGRRHAGRDEDEGIGHGAHDCRDCGEALCEACFSKRNHLCHRSPCDERIQSRVRFESATTQMSLFRWQTHTKEAKQPRKHGAPQRHCHFAVCPQ
jgi:hypothetical protein